MTPFTISDTRGLVLLPHSIGPADPARGGIVLTGGEISFLCPCHSPDIANLGKGTSSILLWPILRGILIN